MSRDDNIVTIQNYFKQIQKIPVLTAEEEKELAIKAHAGDLEAKNKMWLSNLKLVVKIVNNYCNTHPDAVVEASDLIQEGNKILSDVIDNFDPDLGFKFSTYASRSIIHTISRTINDKGRTIRLSANVVKDISIMKETISRLQQELMREPSIPEIAEAMGKTAEQVGELIKEDKYIESLDREIGEDDDSAPIGEMVADEKADPDKMAKQREDKETLYTLVRTLSEREQYVFIRRHELFGCPKYTLEELGRDLGITRERVRQIDAKAFRKVQRRITLLDEATRAELSGSIHDDPEIDPETIRK